MIVKGKPKCNCPKADECPKTGPRVCGSNGEDYDNECHLKADACRQNNPIYAVHNGSCRKF